MDAEKQDKVEEFIYQAVAEDKDTERRVTSLGYFRVKEDAYNALIKFIETNKSNNRACYENLTVQKHKLQ